MVAALAVGGSVPDTAGVVCCVAAGMASLGLVVWAAAAVLSARRSRLRFTVPSAVRAAISELAPDVVLYFGGPAAALYQLEMWLPVLERSEHRTLVVMRSREAWRRLGPTTLPVVCAPADTVLTGLDLRSVRAALFVANGAANVHLLRMGGMRTAFIGHGDSDKASSRNPFVKVYDEVWVAGPAGARRYGDTDTRTMSTLVREVGRPQALVSKQRVRHDGALTVVYAPTWEGWGDDSHHTSLPRDGAAIVRMLLQTPGVRVVYRPHPLTGTRDRVVRAAHRDVITLLHAAGAPAETPRRDVGSTAVLDDVDLMRAERDIVDAAPESSFWTGHDAATPRIAAGGWPGLASVLDHADLLVCDVSGVLSDWIAKDRPVAVANPGRLAEADFEERYPSSRAGRILGAGGAGLRELLEAVLQGEDPTAAARAQVRQELLGTPENALRRFESALDDLTR
jgi:hypothetical protein